MKERAMTKKEHIQETVRQFYRARVWGHESFTCPSNESAAMNFIDAVFHLVDVANDAAENIAKEAAMPTAVTKKK
jgi:hypothetical protein